MSWGGRRVRAYRRGGVNADLREERTVFMYLDGLIDCVNISVVLSLLGFAKHVLHRNHSLWRVGQTT